MRAQPGDVISLPAYIETADGVPVTGENANVLFDINYLDGTAPSSGNASTREIGDGWYVYDYTVSLGKSFVYIARHTSYKNFPGGVVEVSRATVDANIASHSHANNTDEQDMLDLVIAGNNNAYIPVIYVNLENLTQDATIRVYSLVYNAEELIETIAWTTADPDVVKITNHICTGAVGFRLTLQSGTVEGAGRIVGLTYVLQS